MSAAIFKAEPSNAMPPASTEDTIIEARRERAFPFVDDETDAHPARTVSPLERCRTVFRELGERMSSFDLSRQIYG